VGDLVGSESRSHEPGALEFAVSDPSQLSSLRDWLRGEPGVEVDLTPGEPGSGELGVMDALTVLASSSGVVAALKVLPEFIRSRRSGFRIETVVKGRPFTLDATNVEEILPILERLLGE
jgi:hypothetical protein